MMLTVSILAVAAVVAVALAARQRTRSEFRRFQQLEKISESPKFDDNSERIAALLEGRCCDADELRAATAAISAEHVLVVADASGEVIAKAGKPLDTVSELQFSANGEGVAVEATRREHNRAATRVSLRFHIAGIPVRMTNGNTAYVYAFPIPEMEPERLAAVFLGSVDRSLLLATILIAAMVLLATWTLTQRFVSPIEELRAAARDLARGNLGRRVVNPGADEISELSTSFNNMAAELEKQQSLRRNLVHDVVHELRTPLTALRCRIDSVTDGVSKDARRELAGANDEINHLARLVEDLHEVALAEAGELKFSISDALLGPIIESAARAAGLEGDGRLRLALDNGLVVRGDAVRLRQVVLNMLTNAARYTPSEGTISVRAFQRQGEAVVEVHNTGSNLNGEEIAHAFDRFYRADPSRQRASGGTGLGLSIVKHLVEAQGGRVWSRSDDSGVSFAFALPPAT